MSQAASHDDVHLLMVIAEDPDHRSRLAAALSELLAGPGPPPVYAAASLEEASERVRAGREWTIVCHCEPPGEFWSRRISRLAALDVGPVIVITPTGDDEFLGDVFALGASGHVMWSELLGTDPPRARTRSAIELARRHWRLDRYARDLTHSLEQANADLRRRAQRQRLITASAQRFMDDVAHDLRGPLASIGCFAEMLSDGIFGPVTPAQAPGLDLIRTTAVELHATVNDFLDSSRIRTGTIVVDRRTIDAQAKLEAVASLLQPQALRRETRVETNAASLPPAFGDPVRVRRVLQNLLVNAIDHGPPRGVIRLDGERRGDWIRLSVIDTGPGIAAETAERIAERFRRGASEGRASDGLGLGLAIALDFARASLGRLEFTSEAGTGSTFTFVLPVAEDGPVRRAAERRWREDDETRVLWLDVHHVPDADASAVRVWLAARLGTTGVVLPDHRDERLRVGRPGDDLGEWIAILERDRAAAPDGSPVSRIRFHAADARPDDRADPHADTGTPPPDPRIQIIDRAPYARPVPGGVRVPRPHGR